MNGLAQIPNQKKSPSIVGSGLEWKVQQQIFLFYTQEDEMDSPCLDPVYTLNSSPKVSLQHEAKSEILRSDSMISDYNAIVDIVDSMDEVIMISVYAEEAPFNPEELEINVDIAPINCEDPAEVLSRVISEWVAKKPHHLNSYIFGLKTNGI